MSNKKFDSIILDIDGTIWDTTNIVAEGWNNAIDRTFPNVPHVTAEIIKGQFGKTMNVIAQNLFPMLNDEEKNILKHEIHAEEQLMIPKITEDITFPNVRRLIPELSKTYKMFIVSNCHNGYIRVTIEKNGLAPYITDWECHGNTGKSKGENIKDVIIRNNLTSPIYVGDTQGDYEACKEANVPFIWAAYGFGKPEGYFAKINDFSELQSVLESTNI